MDLKKVYVWRKQDKGKFYTCLPCNLNSLTIKLLWRESINSVFLSLNRKTCSNMYFTCSFDYDLSFFIIYRDEIDNNEQRWKDLVFTQRISLVTPGECRAGVIKLSPDNFHLRSFLELRKRCLRGKNIILIFSK